MLAAIIQTHETNFFDEFHVFPAEQIVQLQVPVSLIQAQTTGSLTLTFRADDGTTSDTFTLADKYANTIIL